MTYGATVTSPEHAFTTLDSRKPTTAFVVVNDRHENVARLTASLASVKWANVDMAFLNGDMVHAFKDEAQLYRCVVDPCVESFATRVPLVYVRGNHDTRGSFARRLLDYFPTDSGRYYYTLRQGPVVFLVLDGGEDKPDGEQRILRAGEFRALPAARGGVAGAADRGAGLPESAVPCLRDAHAAGPKPNPKFIRPQWLQENVVPLLNRGKVDLLICGHRHHYAIQPAGQNGLDFPMITGGTETVIRV